jgi:hypothetical protein
MKQNGPPWPAFHIFAIVHDRCFDRLIASESDFGQRAQNAIRGLTFHNSGFVQDSLNHE